MLDLSPGTVLGGTWKLSRPLGEGGMGAVWIADHARLPKQFAVKVLHELSSDDEQLLARFKREAEIACRLDHPHIVQVVDFDVESGSPYIVMELLKGDSLAERLARGAMTGREATVLLRQIASALEAAHAESVVHRDLTPRNVFLLDEEVTTADGVPFRVKVLDFGISKVLGGSTIRTAESAVMGTPAYMAPEQARGEQSAIGPRTDQFALGVVMYEALCGMRPFDGESVPSVLYRVVHEQPEDLARITVADDITEAMVSAVQRAMAKDQADRFSSVTEFAEAFSGVSRTKAAVTTSAVRSSPALDVTLHSDPDSASVGVLATLQSDPSAGLPVSPTDRTLARLDPGDATLAGPTTSPPAPSAPAGLDTGLDHSGESKVAPPSGAWRPWTIAATILLLAAGGIALATLGSGDGERVSDRKTEQPIAKADPTAAPDTAAPPALGDARSGPASATPQDALPTVTLDVVVSEPDAAPDAPTGADTLATTADVVAPEPAVKKRAPRKAAKRSSKRQAARDADAAGKKATNEKAAKLLAQARAALAAKQAIRAEDLARKSLQEQSTSQAIEVMVKAKCMQKRISGAAGMARRLSKRRQKAMSKYCKDKHGLQLPL